jgi:hypothetical protein
VPEIHCLHYGDSKNPIAEIVPDSNWSGMWRIAWPDGRLSDMVNLTRARDAAQVIAERGPPKRNKASPSVGNKIRRTGSSEPAGARSLRIRTTSNPSVFLGPKGPQ